jgi:all-trans-retinol 13,14-reductase
MTLGRPYRPAAVQGQTWDTIIVGSGIGGLWTAALLAREGQRVLVLERHFRVGGFSHTFHRKGFDFDVGVHYVGDLERRRSNLRRISDFVTEGRLEWAPLDPVYDILIYPDARYELASGPAAFKQSLLGYFPGEAAALNRYLELVQQSSTAYFVDRMTGTGLPAAVQDLARRTTKDVLLDLTSDHRLISVLTGQWGNYGDPPGQSSFLNHAQVVKHYLQGAAYPVGGAGRIAASVVPLIESRGGTVLVNAEVTAILTDEGRATGVRLVDGTELRARAVVSNAGARNTMLRLLPPGAAPIGQAEMASVRPSASHSCLYVGLSDSDAAFAFPRANLWAFPTYDHDENMARYFADPDEPLPLVYISFASAKDPEWAARRPGRSTIQVITATPFSSVARWKEARWKRRGAEYEAFKASLAARLLDALYTHVPGVRGKVAYSELSTPLSTVHFTNYAEGEIYGIEHTPHRLSLRSLRPRTEVPQLYMTGQDVWAAGVGSAMLSGMHAASEVLGRNLFKDMVLATMKVPI